MLGFEFSLLAGLFQLSLFFSFLPGSLGAFSLMLSFGLLQFFIGSLVNSRPAVGRGFGGRRLELSLHRHPLGLFLVLLDHRSVDVLRVFQVPKPVHDAFQHHGYDSLFNSRGHAHLDRLVLAVAGFDLQKLLEGEEAVDAHIDFIGKNGLGGGDRLENAAGVHIHRAQVHGDLVHAVLRRAPQPPVFGAESAGQSVGFIGGDAALQEYVGPLQGRQPAIIIVIIPVVAVALGGRDDFAFGQQTLQPIAFHRNEPPGSVQGFQEHVDRALGDRGGEGTHVGQRFILTGLIAEVVDAHANLALGRRQSGQLFIGVADSGNLRRHDIELAHRHAASRDGRHYDQQTQ